MADTPLPAHQRVEVAIAHIQVERLLNGLVPRHEKEIRRRLLASDGLFEAAEAILSVPSTDPNDVVAAMTAMGTRVAGLTDPRSTRLREQLAEAMRNMARRVHDGALKLPLPWRPLQHGLAAALESGGFRVRGAHYRARELVRGAYTLSPGEREFALGFIRADASLPDVALRAIGSIGVRGVGRALYAVHCTGDGRQDLLAAAALRRIESVAAARWWSDAALEMWKTPWATSPDAYELAGDLMGGAHSHPGAQSMRALRWARSACIWRADLGGWLRFLVANVRDGDDVERDAAEMVESLVAAAWAGSATGTDMTQPLLSALLNADAPGLEEYLQDAYTQIASSHPRRYRPSLADRARAMEELSIPLDYLAVPYNYADDADRHVLDGLAPLGAVPRTYFLSLQLLSAGQRADDVAIGFARRHLTEACIGDLWTAVSDLKRAEHPDGMRVARRAFGAVAGLLEMEGPQWQATAREWRAAESACSRLLMMEALASPHDVRLPAIDPHLGEWVRGELLWPSPQRGSGSADAYVDRADRIRLALVRAGALASPADESSKHDVLEALRDGLSYMTREHAAPSARWRVLRSDPGFKVMVELWAASIRKLSVTAPEHALVTPNEVV